jgi:hypothetical protein
MYVIVSKNTPCLIHLASIIDLLQLQSEHKSVAIMHGVGSDAVNFHDIEPSVHGVDMCEIMGLFGSWLAWLTLPNFFTKVSFSNQTTNLR